MRLKFFGAAGTVTGSCHMIETGATRILVDCGVFQGSRSLRERNYQPFPFNPTGLDFVLLTHAHIDHSGAIPKLVKQGFSGKIFATGATTDLCEVMLPDSGYIQEMEVERLNRKNSRSGKQLVTPIYTAEEARESMRYFKRVSYGETISLNNNISVRFLDAGHILGSAMLEIWIREGEKQTKLLFTGDLGSDNKPFVNDPTDVAAADYVIMESTYGARLHKDSGNRIEKLHDVLWETHGKGGNLIIPAFAVERTQDLLYDMNLLMLEKRFPPMQVYIDSPMAVAATQVFKNHPECFDQETRELIRQGKDPLALPGLVFSQTTEESIALNNIPGGAVILSASGMCDAGRIKHHLKHNLWRKESTVLFVGYQAEGTKGRRLMEGEKSIRIHGEEVAVKADIKSIDGFSAHADQKELLDWLGNFTEPPQRVFLVHGEPESTDVFSRLVEERLNIPVTVPQWLDAVDLTPGPVVSQEDVLKAHSLVANKLKSLLEVKGGEGNYTEIMRQLGHLDGLIEKIKTKAG
ncbi:metallo-beta-lactamase family protein [Desulfocucumis palustris]|uniref:Metallo-beta-lactamase family protein n=1 Tax=Desulfocucumis palustris TaxID=1898651 RepID=A0A2L2XAG6_9FIRM|nr:MBL fold metallo-hydrolase [Desulfocucumis palustris]GBF33267.1 metallo-beta-lactamase family protein [Desulfocucumis palustris]